MRSGGARESVVSAGVSTPRFSQEQNEVIGTWGRGQAVLAGAGCGKTTTLVEKCAELLRREPQARFAAVSFTEKSAGDLREKLALRLPRSADGPALAPHWVMTIHGLCRAVAREFPREAGIDGEESVLSESEARLLWEQVLDSLWLDPLPEGASRAMDLLLERESRASLERLIARLRDLHGFGAQERFEAQAGDPRVEALFALAGHARERYARLKRRRGALDFEDLESCARRALREAPVRAAYHRRFELVLVDEFQDTNLVQAEVLWAFARPDQSNLCVVGDPKQSIYRFREADVSVFEELCARLPERRLLTGNFRCRPGIIEFTNRVCEPAFAESGMGYEKLRAEREPAALPPLLRLELGGPEGLAAWLAEEQASERGIKGVALLLRRVRGAEKWLRPLAARGVPFAVGSGGLFWEDPRVRELTALLRWWDQPAHSLSGATFLRAPWVGIPDETLDAWLRPPRARPDESDRERAARAGRELPGRFLESGHAIAGRLRPLWDAPARPGDLILALLEDPRAEAELGAAALGLWHRAEELSSRGLDASAVVRELARSRDERPRDRDVPPPDQQGQLRVLTIHGSKGLEFPRVILADFEGKTRSKPMPEIYWDRARGAFLAPRDEDGGRLPKDPDEAPWRAAEAAGRLAESKRLFYVALTRAREQLVLACLAPPAEKGEPEPGLFSEDHWRSWINASDAVERVSAPLGGRSGGADAATAAFPEKESLGRLEAPAPDWRRPRHSVTEWVLLSQCQRSYAWRVLSPPAGARPRPGEDPWSTPVPEPQPEETGAAAALSPREIGTRVHACLERLDWEGLERLERDAGGAFQAAPVVEWMRGSEWMLPADPAKGREVHAELAFEIPIERGEVLVGAMDRLIVVRDAGGRVVSARVVDFKVARAGKTAAELVEAYAPQMELYAWAATRLLGEVPERLEASLAHLSSAGVRAVEVPLAPWVRESGIPRVARQRIDEIRVLSRARPGENPGARPGPHCGFCEFRPLCPEGSASRA
ncbi:MAG: UvrD-helicase domain-containing protein [Bdellovibrionales bacterium]|nr:UvrD-helicase domain-containing protein [Bdellovibrionales bacterium]